MPALRAISLVLLVAGLAAFGAGVVRDERVPAIVGFALAALSVAIGLLAHRIDR
jgi:hypothetical protein